MNDAAEKFPTTSSKGTRVLGVASLVGIVVTTLYAFVVSKPEEFLGESIRIMYVHVPTISIAYLAMIANACFSAFYLWKRTVFSDLMAAVTGEIGVVLLALGLISGSLWGRATWGVFWRWDARLTTTTLLFLMYLGYLAVRSLPAEPQSRGTRSAVVGILSAMLIYPVHMSVTWWGSLHQSSTLFDPNDPRNNTHIAGTQLFTLFLGFVTVTLIGIWLTMHRFRVAWLTEQVAEHELADSIEARRAEGGPPAGAAGAAQPDRVALAGEPS